MTLEEVIAHVLETLETDSGDGGPLKPVRTAEGIGLVGSDAGSVFLLTIRTATLGLNPNDV